MFTSKKMKRSVVLRAPPFDSKFERRYTHADGSCFFHSLAHVLRDVDGIADDRVRDIGLRLRRDLIDRREWNAYRDALPDHVRQMAPTLREARCSEYYADEFLWRYVSDLLKLTIVLIEGRDRIFVTPDENPYPVCCLMAFVDGNHFEPIMLAETNEKVNDSLPVDAIRQRLGADVEMPGVLAMNHPVVASLLSKPSSVSGEVQRA